MQLIWTPKLINICEEDTRKLFVSPCFIPKKKMQRPFSIFLSHFFLFFSFFVIVPFAIYLRLIIKQPKAYVLFAQKDENKLVASLTTCHLPHYATPSTSTWFKSSRVESSWVESELSPVEFSYKIYLFRRNDLLPKGRPKKKAKAKPKDPWQAGYEVQGIVSSFGNEVTFGSVKILIALPYSNWKAHLELSRFIFSFFSSFLFDSFPSFLLFVKSLETLPLGIPKVSL